MVIKRLVNTKFSESKSKDVKELATILAEYYINKGKLPKDMKAVTIFDKVLNKAIDNGLKSDTANPNEKLMEHSKMYGAVIDAFEQAGFEVKSNEGEYYFALR